MMDWKNIKTIAIVGASPNPERASNEVMRYFLDNGLNVVPINPNYSEVLGKSCYPSLMDVPPSIAMSIDMVDIFRKSEFVLHIMRDVIELKKRYNNVKVVWMQPGAVNEKAVEMGHQAGLEVIFNACAMINHKSLKER